MMDRETRRFIWATFLLTSVAASVAASVVAAIIGLAANDRMLIVVAAANAIVAAVIAIRVARMWR